MDINSRYKVALDGFTIWGTHENQFFGYCNQKKDIYYLRQLLNLKPNLNETVQAGLPKDCEIQSDKPIPPIGVGAVTAVKKEEAPSSGKKAKRQYIDTLADGFSYLRGMDDTPEIKQAKFDFLVCDQQRKDCEDERRAHKAEISEYKEIQQMIQNLRKQMKEDGLDDDDRLDLQEDLNRLKRKKNELAKKLGY